MAKRPFIYRFAKFVEIAIWAVVWTIFSVLFCWASIALSCIDFLPQILRAILSVAFFAGSIGWLVRTRKKNRAMAIIIVGVIIVFGMWQFVTPRNDRNWADNQQFLAESKIDDGIVLLKNVRNSEYQSETEFESRFQDLTFEVSEIKSVWFVVQHFSWIEGLAHTFVTFEIDPAEEGIENRYISLSVEIRRENDEAYSPFWGMFKRYELIYVVGEERDILGVRTHHRNDRIYLYKVNVSPEIAQTLFVRYSETIEQLLKRPRFYDTLFNNCTNNIIYQTNRIQADHIDPRTLQIVFPGYSDRYAFGRGLIGSKGLAFEQLQLESRIDEVAKSIPLDSNFSKRLRASMAGQ